MPIHHARVPLVRAFEGRMSVVVLNAPCVLCPKSYATTLVLDLDIYLFGAFGRSTLTGIIGEVHILPMFPLLRFVDFHCSSSTFR